MCNLAGYTGARQAAPILIDMIRKQEGLDSGYFTGIATYHEGKIYYAKVVGDLDQLLSRTDAASLPGTTGIIHSRTPGNPFDSWSHPFVTEENGQIVSAFATNGISGCRSEEFKAISQAHARMLEQLGYEFKSRLPAGSKGSTTLEDGSPVHPSEVQAHYAAMLMKNGCSAVEAMERLFTDQVKEGAALFLSLTQPDAITWTRTSFPMQLAFADHGAYLATAPQAFPADAGETLILPALSSGLVTGNGYTCKKYSNPPFTVAPITPKVWQAAYTKITEALAQPHHLYGLGELFLDEFDTADCTQKNAVTYCVLGELARQGRLREENRRAPHRREDLTAPDKFMWLENA